MVNRSKQICIVLILMIIVPFNNSCSKTYLPPKAGEWNVIIDKRKDISFNFTVDSEGKTIENLSVSFDSFNCTPEEFGGINGKAKFTPLGGEKIIDHKFNLRYRFSWTVITISGEFDPSGDKAFGLCTIEFGSKCSFNWQATKDDLSLKK